MPITRTVILNSSNFNSSGSGNSFVYKFPTSVDFKPLDKIGIQSISLYNSFFNITAALANNLMTLIFPAYTPTGVTSVFNGFIGNSVSFLGSISNPDSFELYGSTVGSTVALTGFIGGVKNTIAGGYISGTVLKVTSGTPALAIGMYINGSNVSIVSGANPTWNLSSSSLGTIGSLASPVSTIFACTTGNILYVTTPPTSSLTTTTANPTIFITSSIFTSYSLPGVSQLTTSVNTYNTNANNIYVPLVSITAGLGSSTFIGTSDATVFVGMAFTFGTVTCNILNVSTTGTLNTISLDTVVGIFSGTLIQNVKVPTSNGLPTFSILTVNKVTSGNGILQSYILSGVGVNANISITKQISSFSTTSNADGIYKISYNPTVNTVAMIATDSVSTNSVLNVTYVTSGTITQGMILKDSNNIISNYNITIGSQITGTTGGIGTYNISSTSFIVPSIFPEEIIGSSAYSTSINIPIIIPDGYYSVSSLNYFLQNIMIQNNLYLTDSTGQNNTYFIELLQNSISYSVQINIFPLPTSLSSTQFYPADALWALPNTAQTPQLLINSNLMNWFGFSSSYSYSNPTTSISNGYLQVPSTINTLNGVLKSYVSNICPQINTISSIVIRCNLINNPFSNPSDNFLSVPLEASFGNLISINYSPIMINVRGGMEQNLILSFFDPDDFPITLTDNDLSCQLVIEQSNVF